MFAFLFAKLPTPLQELLERCNEHRRGSGDVDSNTELYYLYLGQNRTHLSIAL